MKKLKKELKNFARALANGNSFQDAEAVEIQLTALCLTSAKFFESFTRPTKREPRT